MSSGVRSLHLLVTELLQYNLSKLAIGGGKKNVKSARIASSWWGSTMLQSVSIPSLWSCFSERLRSHLYVCIVKVNAMFGSDILGWCGWHNGKIWNMCTTINKVSQYTMKPFKMAKSSSQSDVPKRWDSMALWILIALMWPRLVFMSARCVCVTSHV